MVQPAVQVFDFLILVGLAVHFGGVAPAFLHGWMQVRYVQLAGVGALSPSQSSWFSGMVMVGRCTGRACLQWVQRDVGRYALAQVHVKEMVIADHAFQLVQMPFVVNFVLASQVWERNVGGVGGWYASLCEAPFQRRKAGGRRWLVLDWTVRRRVT